MATSASNRDFGRTNWKTKAREKKSRNTEALDANLRMIFSSLAELLVASGYGYARVGKLVKISFVNAAKSIGREQHERVSKARIAALTGLTRTEVSQLLRIGDQPPVSSADPANRAFRVVQGWLTDPLFMRPNNSPRPLPFKGKKLSFSHLVKTYSGDIPARAMLSEMERLRIVRLDAHDLVHLVRTTLEVSRRTTLAMRAISPWIEMLTTRSSQNRLGEVTSKAKQVNLTFNSLPQLLAAVRELEHRRLAFVNGLEQMGAESPTGKKHFLRISIAVAAERTVPRTQNR